MTQKLWAKTLRAMNEETIGARLVRLALAHPKFAGMTKAALAEAFDISYETLRKWTVGLTGPTRAKADELAALLEVPTETLTHGVEYLPVPAEQKPGVGSSLLDGEAQPMSPEWDKIPSRPQLKTVLWRDEKMLRALQRFCVVAPDDTMAPVIRRGSTAIFDKTLLPARNGDYVLLTDMRGDWHIREYQGTPDGQWTALALQDRLPPLHSAPHGLEVLAVFDGTMGRRG